MKKGLGSKRLNQARITQNLKVDHGVGLRIWNNLPIGTVRFTEQRIDGSHRILPLPQNYRTWLDALRLPHQTII
jgi:hypothetical protein